MLDTIEISKIANLSKKEIKKSIRDSVVMGGVVGMTTALEALIPVIENLTKMDFGSNTFIYSFVISIIILPMLNRYLNILRVK